MSSPLLSVEEALARILALVGPSPIETIPLERALGRVLARDVTARRTQPPFASSAMDGYAVCAEDTRAGTRLEIVGESAAGHRSDAHISPGKAVRIFTGAPLPAGADTIVIQENVTRTGNRIVLDTDTMPGAFVRPAGGDFTAGAVFSAPARLGPREIALLAAMNIARIAVYRRPVIALIPTGDELVLPGEEPGPDQIVSSNNYGLAAMIEQAGAQARLCPIARDNRESLIATLETARDADMIVTLGGASVGDHDLVADVLGGSGLELDFYKIAMRPGKPLMAGRIGTSVMIGLPGNPVSAMVCGEVFLRPAIDAALGLPAGMRPHKTARLGAPLGPNGGRAHYMRAVLSLDDAGDTMITPCENQDSSLLSVLTRANALLIRPVGDPAQAAGARVRYIPLG